MKTFPVSQTVLTSALRNTLTSRDTFHVSEICHTIRTAWNNLDSNFQHTIFNDTLTQYQFEIARGTLFGDRLNLQSWQSLLAFMSETVTTDPTERKIVLDRIYQSGLSED